MRAKFTDDLLGLPDGAEMASILRTCVHCGFCNATCPTYQLTGDELDGPRGRIYLIKSMLEGAGVGQSTQMHLDRCLTCRACETTCPSGVRYTRLLELARPMVETKVGRRPWERLKRGLIRHIVPYRRRFAFLMGAARIFKPLYPRALRELVPAPADTAEPPSAARPRKMVLLDGCAQSAAAPEINAAAREIFARLGVQLLSFPGSGCCGAVSYHLGEVAEAQRFARRNLDTWWAAVAAGAEAVVATSTGCTMMLKEYGDLLADDPAYADRAQQLASLVRDPCEVIDPTELGRSYRVNSDQRIAFHAPCTMQHGLRVAARAEACLRAVGFELADVADAHLCCGSAGSYSLLQPALANQLLDQKLIALQGAAPTILASANIGCLMHLRRRAAVPVVHWLELIRRHRVGP
jgi:glycolate oxidase iron-sulfur subunit